MGDSWPRCPFDRSPMTLGPPLTSAPGIMFLTPLFFLDFPLHFLPFICYKQFTESRRVAKPVVFVKHTVSSGN
jgi:hypothetical protein